MQRICTIACGYELPCGYERQRVDEHPTGLIDSCLRPLAGARSYLRQPVPEILNRLAKLQGQRRFGRETVRGSAPVVVETRLERVEKHPLRPGDLRELPVAAEVAVGL